MKITVNDTTETRKDIAVAIEGAEIAEADKSIIATFSKQAKIPGFRPGKAPEAMIRSRYKKEIQEELGRKMMQSVYEHVVKESGLSIYTVVDFPEPSAFVAGEDKSVDLTVDVTPEFELPEYKGLEVEASSVEVTDEEIDKEIEAQLRQRASFDPVERPVAANDYVKISYTGTIDGEEIAPQLEDLPPLRSWGTVADTWEEAGSEEAKQYGVPAIIDALVGASAGDTITAEQVIADDFQAEGLRGKTVSYSIEVKEVRERKMPPMDEKFFAAMQVENEADLKASIMDRIEAQKKQQVEESKRNQLMEKLGGAVEFAIPESAIERETQQVMARVMMQNMQRGIDESEFEKNKEALHAQSTEVAKRDVKLQLLLGRIAEKEEITVEDQDISRAIMSIAQQQRRTPDDIVKELRKDRSRVMDIQRQIQLSKTVDFILKEAKTVEVAAVSE